MRLFNKEQIYVVTGASSGIGQRIAISLCNEGASVIGIGRKEERLIQTKKMCDFPDNFFCEMRDLTKDIDSLSQYITDLKNKYGKFQGLVCSAGAIAVEPFMMLQYETLQDIFNINYFSPLFLIKGFLDKRNILKDNVAIVSIATIATQLHDKGMTVYTGSKSALIQSCKCIANEYSNKGIRINTISPADIITPMTERIENIRGSRSELYPLGQPTTNDVADLTLYLLSDKSKHITGCDFIINGGLIV